MTDNVKLLPCPFCGGAAELARVAGGVSVKEVARCRSANCPIAWMEFRPDEWNRRVPASGAAQGEALRYLIRLEPHSTLGQRATKVLQMNVGGNWQDVAEPPQVTESEDEKVSRCLKQAAVNVRPLTDQLLTDTEVNRLPPRRRAEAMRNRAAPPLPAQPLTVGGDFEVWFYSAAHRKKYTTDHPAFLAASEAWAVRVSNGGTELYGRECALHGCQLLKNRSTK